MEPVLPPLYSRWMQELLGASMEPEHKATCRDCAMVAKPGVDDAPQDVHYLPDVKCCGYYPNLPNFSVGQILRDGTCAGSQHLLGRIAKGIRATPLGVDKPAMYALLQRGAPARAFGQVSQLRCGYLTPDGACGIWRHREATCTTFFCRFNRGAAGRELWEQLRLLLRVIEQQLAMWCVLELDVGDAAIARLVVPRSSDAPLELSELRNEETEPEHAELWGRWAGRELDFYVEAGKLVESLSWARLLEITGPLVSAQARVVKAVHAGLADPAVPDELTVGAHRARDLGDGRSRLLGYSVIDPVEVPTTMRVQLHRFDALPTTEAIAELGIDAGMVRTLVDHRVLIPRSTLVRKRSRS